LHSNSDSPNNTAVIRCKTWSNKTNILTAQQYFSAKFKLLMQLQTNTYQITTITFLVSAYNHTHFSWQNLS